MGPITARSERPAPTRLVSPSSTTSTTMASSGTTSPATTSSPGCARTPMSSCDSLASPSPRLTSNKRQVHLHSSSPVHQHLCPLPLPQQSPDLGSRSHACAGTPYITLGYRHH